MKLKLLCFIIVALLSQHLLNAQAPFAKNITPISAKSVSFFDGLHGYMVGDRAKILYTADGGYTWDHYFTGIFKNYNKIRFYDQNLGAIVGKDLTMIVTKNGGASWQQISGAFGLTTGDFSDIWFVDASTWLVSGTEGVLKTTDGGLTWVNTTLQGNVTDLTFIDNQTGYFLVSGGYFFLYKSIDGGNSWSYFYPGVTTKPNAFHFFNVNDGLLAMESGQIYRTNDGGNSFTEVYTGTKELNGFVFSNSQDGYSFGMDGTILKTADAGLTWTDVPGAITNYDLYAANMASGNNATFYGENGLRIRTTNGTSAILESEFTIEKAQGLWAVAFIDENSGLVGGYNNSSNQQGILLRTIDGGNSWKKSSFPSLNIEFRGLHYVNASKVFALGETFNGTDGIFVSNDSGSTFSAVILPDTLIYNRAFYDMNSFGNDTLFIIGSCDPNCMNSFYQSYDGGATWTAGGYAEGFDVSMLNSQTGVVASGAGLVHLTTDGGDTFTVSPDLSINSIPAAEYVTANTIYAAGGMGDIFKSTNVGGIWNSIRTTTGNDGFAKMDFSDENTGFIIGSNSILISSMQYGGPFILYTNDGGVSFQEILAGYDFEYLSSSLTNFQMLNTNTGYAVGRSANIIKICPTCSNNYVVAGINNTSKTQESVSIYPNPATDNIFIQSTDKIKEVKCVNYLGQTVAVKIKNNSIDVSSLSTGMYFLNITTEKEENITKKFIKE